jgi:hypothetical protein
MAKTGRGFTAGFEREAVALLESRNRPIRRLEVARLFRELDRTRWTG